MHQAPLCIRRLSKIQCTVHAEENQVDGIMRLVFHRFRQRHDRHLAPSPFTGSGCLVNTVEILGTAAFEQVFFASPPKCLTLP